MTAGSFTASALTTGNLAARHWTHRTISAYSGRRVARPHNRRAAAASPARGSSPAPHATGAPDHEHRDRDRASGRAGQPYPYQRVELVEPDWTRFPGWADVTADEWESVQWQRAHCVKNVKQLRELMGDLLDERFYADLERDQAERATMSMLVPPQMMNTMVPTFVARRRRAR